MNEWVAVIDRNPEKEGLYLVTIINQKNGQREIKTSYFDESGWKNSRTVAWKDVFNCEPYQGKTQFDGIIARNQKNKERKLEREKETFELRLRGLSFPKISRELGMAYTTSTNDLYAYLRRKEGCSESCFQCKHAFVTYDGHWDLKCKKLDFAFISDHTGCRLYEYVGESKKRTLCENCKYLRKDRFSYGDGYCQLRSKDINYDETCERGEAKDEI